MYGDEGGGFGGNDPGVEVGQLVRLQVAAQDLKGVCCTLGCIFVLKKRVSRNLRREICSSKQGGQMGITKLLACRCLALLDLRDYGSAMQQNLILFFPWIALGWRVVGSMDQRD